MKERHRVHRFFFNYLKPYWKYEFLLLFIIFITTLSSLISPLVLRLIIDDILPNKNLNLLLTILILLIVIYIVRIGLTVLSDTLFEKVSNFIMIDLQKDIFMHLSLLDISFYEQNDIGNIIYRINNEVGNIRNFLSRSLIQVINSTIVLFCLTFILSFLSVELFMIVLYVVPVIILNNLKFRPIIENLIKKTREKDSEVLNFLIEKLRKIKTIKLYNKYNYELNALHIKLQDLLKLNLKSVLNISFSRNLSIFFIASTPVLVLYYGGKNVIIESMTIGSVVAFIQYLNRFYNPIHSLLNIYIDLLRTTVSMERIYEYFQNPVVKDNELQIDFRIQRKIRIVDLKFSYDKLVVFDNLHVEFNQGKKYGIVGESGCGKSTLINLLCGFYKYRQGSILIDEQELSEINVNQLRDRITLISRDNQVFNDSVYNNIKYANAAISSKDAELAKLQAGLEKLDLHKIIDTDQNNISLGQIQRLGFSRAFVENKDIIMIDEGTSSLDSISEFGVLDKIYRGNSQKIFLIISHRLSTLQNVDYILYLGKEGVLEKGRIDELVEKRGLFYELYKRQIEGHRA